MIGATLVASLYAGLSGAAAIGKAVDFGGWSSLAAAVARRRSAATFLTIGLPLAEAFVAYLLLAAPRAGLVAAAALLALLGAGVLAVAGRLGGRPCACFGTMKAAPVGRRLALRNLALAGGAAAVAPAAGMAPASAAYVALAAAGCSVPVLATWLQRARPRAPARAHRARAPLRAQGALVDVVHPVDLLRVGLHRGHVEVDDDRLLTAAHDDAGQQSSGLALISWCGTYGGT